MGRAEGLRVAGGAGGEVAGRQGRAFLASVLVLNLPVRSISGAPGSDHMLWGESSPPHPAPHQALFPGSPPVVGDAVILEIVCQMPGGHSKEPLSPPLASPSGWNGAEHPHSTRCSQQGAGPRVKRAVQGRYWRAVPCGEHRLPELWNSAPVCETAWV